MAHTVWKGTISFGLVSIPVRLVSATQEQGVSLHQVHAADGGRIRYRRVCELDGEEVPYADIAKGYTMPSGDMVILDEDDLDELPVASSKAIDVSGFVPLEQIDLTGLSRAYYVEPTGDAKPYVMLRQALAESDQVGVVKVALRQRERLALLRAHEDILIVQTMLWPDEIREPEVTIDDSVTVREQEMAMAASFIETLTGDFEPEAYVDEYREALHDVVKAKAEGGDVRPSEEPEREGAEVVDLMEALSRSVDAARKGPGKSTAKRTGKGTATSSAAKKTSGRGSGSSSTSSGSTSSGSTSSSESSSHSSTGKSTARKRTSTSAKNAADKKAPAKKAPAKKAPAETAPVKKSAARTTANKRKAS